MAKKEVATKLIVVESAGAIAELGGISGPVLSPCYVPIDTINLMLNHHRRVFEVNPQNYKEKVRLNLRNLRTQNFTKVNTPTKAHLAPNIYTQPIVRNSNDIKPGKDFSDDTTTASTPTKKTTRKKSEVVEVKEEVSPTEAPAESNDLIASDFVRND